MESFEEIWRHYYPRFRVFIRSFSGFSSADREDCIQEIFLKVYKNLHRYNHRWSFSTWIYRIARNTCIDYRRRLFRRQADELPEDLFDRAGTDGAGTGWSGTGGDDVGWTDAATLQLDVSLDIHRAVEQLEEGQRQLVYLYYGEDLSVSEIASVLGKPEGTVKSLLHRSRKVLKGHLEEAYGPGR